MKNISKMVREASDPASWREEVERAAASYACDDSSRVEAAWQLVSERLDSILVLAFDYRHQAEAFIPVLKDWYTDLRTALVQADTNDPEKRIATTVLWRLLGRIESVYEQHQMELNSRMALEAAHASKVTVVDIQHAQEIAAHLRKAISKIKHLQKDVPGSLFELDIYRNILEAAMQHFEDITEPDQTLLEEAA